MKNIWLIITGIIIGILATMFYLEKQKNTDIHQQSNTLLQSVEHLNKMVTTEAVFSEVYSYKDSDKYMFDLLQFDKNVILLVNAKVQISYDLRKLNVELDSVHKIIKIKNIPQEEVEIFPDIKYYDLQQSTFNQFSSEDLNKINTDAVEQIKNHLDLTTLRLQAKKQFLENLENLYLLSKVLGWKIEDNHLMQNLQADTTLLP